MKKFIFSKIDNGEIFLATAAHESTALERMKMVYPDVVEVDDEGLETSRTPQIESLGEIPRDENGEYIKPDSYFKKAFAYNENDGLHVNLAQARAVKLEEIRARRNSMWVKSDALWIAESSKGADITSLNADKESLRNLPSNASTALDALSDLDAIKNYDAFGSLSLNNDYE